MKILICWIGKTDIDCADGKKADELGPIAQALTSERYDKVVLLNNYPAPKIEQFQHWLPSKAGLHPEIHNISLSSPTAHKEIYSAVRELVGTVQAQTPDAKLTFHISPGTPAMALCWFLLAPVFGARVIESSREKGVQTVDFPFEVSAFFLPDKKLADLTSAVSATHSAFNHILCKSEVMQRVIMRAQHAAARDVTVLIEGESGTGKELFARAIHEASSRSKGPFVPVNCGAIPGELIESLLFGHTKNAFSGAVKDTDGFSDAANKGTIFLDEFGELPPKAQVSLLRALQEKQITRVGETKAHSVDVRIIAATNRNLLEEVGKGAFRSDLFYRVAVACITLPPLRERGDDIELLLDAALTQANQELAIQGQCEDKKFSVQAKKIMASYSWPGNVRELFNTVMRAALWTSGPLIDAEDARQSLFSLPNQATNLLNRPWSDDFALKDVMAEVAKHYLDRAMKDSNNVKAKAAKLLGFKNYQTLTNWVNRYEL